MPPVAPEAAQDGDRGHAALDEDVHGARDAEAAEEERHERDEAEEVAEAGERVGEAPLVVGDRADVQALGGEPGAEAVGELLGVGPGRQAQVGLVAGARAAGQEPGLLDARAGDEDARAEGAAHAHVARHVLDRGPQDEARLAEGDLVADRRARGRRAARRRRPRRPSRRDAPTRRRARSRSRRRTGSRGRRPAPGRAASSGRPAEGHRPEAHDARHVGRRGSSRGAPRRGAPRRPRGRERPRRERGRRPSSARASRCARTRAGCP